MATSPAERQRRSRAHKRGDHSLCDPSKCRGDVAAPALQRTRTPAAAPVSAPPALPVPDLPVADPEERQAGPIEQAVTAYVVKLGFDEDDPRGILGAICVRIAQRIDEGGAQAAAIKELRGMLAQITEVPNQEAGPVDEVRLRRSLRRLDQILAKAS